MVTRRSAVYLLATATVAAAGAGWWYFLPIQQAEQRVRAQLRDPDSARFHAVQVYRGTGGACGYVNAKNGLGGYAGPTHFVIDRAGTVLFDPRIDTLSGTVDQRIAATQKMIDYLTAVEASCPGNR